MGGSTWNSDDYISRQTTRKATGQSAFQYTQSVQSGASKAAVHDSLNPLNAMRECRDSIVHPETLPILVFFDVTGSMGGIPVTLQLKLGKLIDALIGNGYVDHPQILFGATGDAFSDRAPLQVGQFESGIELDNDMANIYLEGNGGGNGGESYALPYYFAATHTSTDAFEKRGKKGYLFTIGDEPCHATITRQQIATIMGDAVEADITAEQAIKMAQEKYECFHLQVNSRFGNFASKQWRDLLGERALVLEDPEAVTEVIASTIGICEGRTSIADITGDLTKAGFDSRLAQSASRSVSVLKDVPRALAKAASTGSLGISGDISGISKL